MSHSRNHSGATSGGATPPSRDSPYSSSPMLSAQNSGGPRGSVQKQMSVTGDRMQIAAAFIRQDTLAIRANRPDFSMPRMVISSAAAASALANPLPRDTLQHMQLTHDKPIEPMNFHSRTPAPPAKSPTAASTGTSSTVAKMHRRYASKATGSSILANLSNEDDDNETTRGTVVKVEPPSPLDQVPMVFPKEVLEALQKEKPYLQDIQLIVSSLHHITQESSVERKLNPPLSPTAEDIAAAKAAVEQAAGGVKVETLHAPLASSRGPGHTRTITAVDPALATLASNVASNNVNVPSIAIGWSGNRKQAVSEMLLQLDSCIDKLLIDQPSLAARLVPNSKGVLTNVRGEFLSSREILALIHSHHSNPSALAPALLALAKMYQNRLLEFQGMDQIRLEIDPPETGGDEETSKYKAVYAQRKIERRAMAQENASKLWNVLRKKGNLLARAVRKSNTPSPLPSSRAMPSTPSASVFKFSAISPATTATGRTTFFASAAGATPNAAAAAQAAGGGGTTPSSATSSVPPTPRVPAPPPKPPVDPKWLRLENQGNLEMYLPWNLIKREMHLFAPELVRLTQLYWRACFMDEDGVVQTGIPNSPKVSPASPAAFSRSRSHMRTNSGEIPNLEGGLLIGLPKKLYTHLFTLVHYVLKPSYLPSYAQQVVAQDWLLDTHMTDRPKDANKVLMSLPQFHLGLFNLVDVWTEGVTLEEYVEFLKKLFEFITEEVPGAQQTLNSQMNAAAAGGGHRRTRSRLPLLDDDDSVNNVEVAQQQVQAPVSSVYARRLKPLTIHTINSLRKLGLKKPTFSELTIDMLREIEWKSRVTDSLSRVSSTASLAGELGGDIRDHYGGMPNLMGHNEYYTPGSDENSPSGRLSPFHQRTNSNSSGGRRSPSLRGGSFDKRNGFASPTGSVRPLTPILNQIEAANQEKKRKEQMARLAASMEEQQSEEMKQNNNSSSNVSSQSHQPSSRATTSHNRAAADRIARLTWKPKAAADGNQGHARRKSKHMEEEHDEGEDTVDSEAILLSPTSAESQPLHKSPKKSSFGKLSWRLPNAMDDDEIHKALQEQFAEMQAEHDAIRAAARKKREEEVHHKRKSSGGDMNYYDNHADEEDDSKAGRAKRRASGGSLSTRVSRTARIPLSERQYPPRPGTARPSSATAAGAFGLSKSNAKKNGKTDAHTPRGVHSLFNPLPVRDFDEERARFARESQDYLRRIKQIQRDAEIQEFVAAQENHAGGAATTTVPHDSNQLLQELQGMVEKEASQADVLSLQQAIATGRLEHLSSYSSSVTPTVSAYPTHMDNGSLVSLLYHAGHSGDKRDRNWRLMPQARVTFLTEHQKKMQQAAETTQARVQAEIMTHETHHQHQQHVLDSGSNFVPSNLSTRPNSARPSTASSSAANRISVRHTLASFQYCRCYQCTELLADPNKPTVDGNGAWRHGEAIHDLIRIDCKPDKRMNLLDSIIQKL